MNRRPLAPVTAETLTDYDRDGIVCLRGVFDADWIAFMGDAVDRAMAAPGDHGEEYGDHGGQFHSATLYDELVRVPLFVRVTVDVPSVSSSSAAS